MSWDSYLDNLCAQSNSADGVQNATKCAIISLEGGASWTTPNHPHGLNLTPSEGQAIADSMKRGDFSKFQASGVTVEGEKYMFIREDGAFASAKKAGLGALSMMKSKSAVVIAFTPEGKAQGKTTMAVGVIVDYLTSVGM